jgi:YesN/AraC family two-component response regulator
MITISIVEDNEPFRQGLEAIIKSENDFSLVASYTSAEKALANLPENPPDIVICDISLPGMRGTELIVRLKD